MKKEAASFFSVVRTGNWLIVDFPQPYDCLSWAVVGGGQMLARSVVWLEVKKGELPPEVIPADFFRTKFEKELSKKCEEVVGLLTAARLDAYVDIQKESGEYSVRSILTAGLTNALRIGDPADSVSHRVGTLNLLSILSHPLSHAAQLEAISIAAEARTAAVLEACVPSSVSGLPSTGTGTDCIVIASPQVPSSDRVSYIGKHTVPGSLLGEAVYLATRMAILK